MSSHQKFNDENVHVTLNRGISTDLTRLYDDYIKENNIRTSYRLSRKKFLEKLIIYAKNNWGEVKGKL